MSFRSRIHCIEGEHELYSTVKSMISVREFTKGSKYFKSSDITKG